MANRATEQALLNLQTRPGGSRKVDLKKLTLNKPPAIIQTNSARDLDSAQFGVTSFPRLLLLTGLVLYPAVTHAELVYQPRAGTEVDALWRSAGSLLLEGLARIFDGLAAVEGRNTSLAQKHFDDATSRLRDSIRSYEKLRSAIPRPRTIVIERLSATRRRQIVRTFDFYKASLPHNEAEAVTLALGETERFVSVLRGYTGVS